MQKTYAEYFKKKYSIEESIEEIQDTRNWDPGRVYSHIGFALERIYKQLQELEKSVQDIKKTLSISQKD